MSQTRKKRDVRTYGRASIYWLYGQEQHLGSTLRSELFRPSSGSGLHGRLTGIVRSSFGMDISKSNTSGFNSIVLSTASSPFSASPQTVHPDSNSRNFRIRLLTIALSSAIKILSGVTVQPHLLPTFPSVCRSSFRLALVKCGREDTEECLSMSAACPT